MSVYYIMSVYTDRQLSMCHWEEYSFITWKNNNNNKTSTICYKFFILFSNYSLYNMEAALCVVNRRPSLHHICLHFLIHLWP